MYSRRQAEKVIKDGRVKVNYELVTTVTQKVSSKDKIFLDDFELKNDYQVDRPRLWMVCLLSSRPHFNFVGE
jgi:16S rRNA U516 pseudouridylate synthase RsuA-like enzyme